MTDALAAVVALSHALGGTERELAILAEGNTSISTGRTRMLVKASGSSLANATDGDFVEMETGPLLELVTSRDSGDDQVREVLTAAKVHPGQPQPSMEALLHAICRAETGAAVVAHTHPTAVNGILCSDRAPQLVAGSLFPDQVVVLGRHNLLIGYADPGLALARAVQSGLREHRDRHGSAPKVVYLANHGIFALATDTAQALAITDMTVKSARILSAALAIGRPAFMSDEQAERIDTRPDELLRRQRLAAAGGGH